MRLSKNPIIASAAAMALAASGAFAADIHYACTGADTPGLQTAVSSAAAGDTVFVDGDCVTTGLLVLNTANLTLRGGPGSITRANGSAIALRRFASGSTIRDLKITAPAANNGITNTSTPPSGNFDQPDDISIINNDITAGRGIQQWNDNAPPLNDLDKRDGTPGGLVTGWVVSGNRIRSTAVNNGVAVFICGDNDQVISNEIWSGTRGILVQNNVWIDVSYPIPGASNNFVHGNKIHAIHPAASTTTFETAITSLGCGACYFSDMDVPGSRAFGNVFDKNCVDASDSTNQRASFGVVQYRMDRESYTKNDIALGADTIRSLADRYGPVVGPPALANGYGDDAAVDAYNSQDSIFSGNDSAGVEFDGVLFLDQDVGSNFPPAGNLVDHDDFGPPLDPAYTSLTVFNQNTDSANPNIAVRNKFSQGGIFYDGTMPASQFGILAGGNHEDAFTTFPGDLAQVHDCYQGLGYAGNVHLSFDAADTSRPDASRLGAAADRHVTSIGDDGLVPADGIEAAGRLVQVNADALAPLGPWRDDAVTVTAAPTVHGQLNREAPVRRRTR